MVGYFIYLFIFQSWIRIHVVARTKCIIIDVRMTSITHLITLVNACRVSSLVRGSRLGAGSEGSLGRRNWSGQVVRGLVLHSVDERIIYYQLEDRHFALLIYLQGKTLDSTHRWRHMILRANQKLSLLTTVISRASNQLARVHVSYNGLHTDNYRWLAYQYHHCSWCDWLMSINRWNMAQSRWDA